MTDTALDVAARIARGDSTALDELEVCLARIRRHNADINAVVTLDEAGAYAAARAADALRAAGGALPPLLGVPMTVKDSFETAGLRTTASHPPLTRHVPAKDATVVARLKAAGAVLVGKTNLPELAATPQCWSPLFGPTRNPWDASLTPGGSSGGSAAAVAMGFSYIDPGSDIGGSIRIPAAYCGVAGLKATENRIPRSGHIPHLPGGRRSVRHLLSLGALAPSVADLQSALAALAGPDGLDIEVPRVPYQPAPSLARPLRIAWWDDFGGLPLCRRTRAALARTVAGLETAGCVVERRCPEGFDVLKAWQAYGWIAGTEIGLGMPALARRLLAVMGRFVTRDQAIAHAFVQGLALDAQRYSRALNTRDRMVRALERFLDSWDTWLCPVASTVAGPQTELVWWRRPPDIAVDDVPWSFVEATVGMMTPFSLTGSPVVVLPAAIEDGLPVGFQFVGRRWQDEVLLATCAAIELVLGGRRLPPRLLDGA
jgi:amidase